MDVKILSQEKTALPRQEVLAEVSYEEVTPSRAQLKKSVAAKTKSKEALVIVKTIKNHYGSRKSIVTAYVYDSEDSMKAIEFPKVLEKNAVKEEKKEESEESTPKEDVSKEEAPKTEESSDNKVEEKGE